MHVPHFGLFVVASLALLLTPGPGVLYIVTRAVAQGRLAGLVSAWGLQAGTVVHLAAAVAGLSALLVSSALAFGLVRWAGAAYLVYLGVRTIAGGGDASAAAELRARQPLGRIFAQGIVVNVFNPKTALFFLAFLPQFADVAKGSVGRQMLFLGLVFMALGLVTDSLYALAGGAAGGWLERRRGFARGQRYVAGTVYIGLGLATAIAGTRK